MKRLLILALAVFVAGCASKYRVDESDTISTIKRDSGIYVLLPENGRYGGTVYSQSGYMVQQEVYVALVTYSDKVTKAPTPLPLDKAFAQARENGSDYVVDLTILHWEDRATEWSGIPDRITIRYAVYDAKTESKVASTVRSASSKWASFGGDHPQDLLPVPTQEFASMLFGRR